MPSYSPPVKDTLFVLNNVLHLERYTNLPGFAGAEPEMLEAILTEGGRFCAEVIQPTNQTGDREGCTRNADGSVTTPSGLQQAYDQLVAGGWTALDRKGTRLNSVTNAHLVCRLQLKKKNEF